MKFGKNKETLKNMKRDEIVELAEEAVDKYFADIDEVVDKIVEEIIDQYGLDEEDLSENDKKFLKERVMRGVLKLDMKE